MAIDQAISILASVTLFELMVAIGLGVTVSDAAGVARDWRLVGAPPWPTTCAFPRLRCCCWCCSGPTPWISPATLWSRPGSSSPRSARGPLTGLPSRDWRKETWASRWG